MRAIPILLALMLACSAAEAGSLLMLGGTGTSATPGTSYLFSENFEAGNTQWTKVSGTASGNFAYATAPAPLVGSYSLLLDETAAGSLTYRNSTIFTATGVGVYYQVNFGVLTGINSADLDKVVSIVDSGTTVICSSGVRDNGAVRWAVQAGGSTSYSTITPSTATTYHVWLDYTPGAGSGSCLLYVATTATKPATPSASRTSLSVVTSAAKLYLWTYNGKVDAVIYDKVRVSNAAIGSDPS